MPKGERRLSMEEVVRDLLAPMKDIMKKFKGFRLPKDSQIANSLGLAQAALKDGREGEAIRLVRSAVWGLQSLLAAFYRNSPAHFTGRMEHMVEGRGRWSVLNFDEDVVARLRKVVENLREQVISETGKVDLGSAVGHYAEARKSFAAAIREQRQREAKRRAKKAAEIAKKVKIRVEELQRNAAVSSAQRQAAIAKREALASEIGSFLK